MGGQPPKPKKDEIMVDVLKSITELSEVFKGEAPRTDEQI